MLTIGVVELSSYAPIAVLMVMAILFALGNMVATRIIGPGREGPVKGISYESGMNPLTSSRKRFNVRFYILAMTFLVFDVELLFLYPWAVAAYIDDSAFEGLGVPLALRPTVFGVMLVFMGTLAIAYIYAWRKGVFKWR